MRRAIEISVENVRAGIGGPFGAVIAREGQIIAEGANLVTSVNDPTAHAEVVAIRKACSALQTFNLSACDLYTSCEPCPMCFGAIYWARPDRVFYAGTCQDAADAGFDDSFIYDQLRLPLRERQIPMEQLLRDEALAGFRQWRQSLQKIPY